VIAGTALAYVLVALPALQIAIPPSYASPLYPPAGIALAAVLVYGRVAMVGAALGGFLANVSLIALRGNVDLIGALVPAATAIGSALQAGAGAWLVQRYARHPRALDEPRDVAVLFGLGGALACVVAPSVATPVLTAAGIVPRTGALETWLTWWVGDTFGAMICTPIALTLILCPLRGPCRARALGIAADLPARAAKRPKPRREGVAWVALDRGRVLLERRPARGLLGGTLAFPSSGWDGSDQPPPLAADWREAGRVRHVFTHFELDLAVLTADAEGDPGRGDWQPLAGFDPAALPGLMRKVWARVSPPAPPPPPG